MNKAKAKTGAPGFDEFWDAYGYKRDRISAERAWNRLSAKDRRAAIAGIWAYRQDCATSGRMMCYAQGYLNRRRWEDDFTQPCEIQNKQIQNTKSGQVAAHQPAMLNVQSSPASDREREAEERNRRYEEMHRRAVSREEAMQDPEYQRAISEC